MEGSCRDLARFLPVILGLSRRPHSVRSTRPPHPSKASQNDIRRFFTGGRFVSSRCERGRMPSSIARRCARIASKAVRTSASERPPGSTCEIFGHDRKSAMRFGSAAVQSPNAGMQEADDPVGRVGRDDRNSGEPSSRITVPEAAMAASLGQKPPHFLSGGMLSRA